MRRQADIAAGTGQCRWRVGGAGGAVAADDVGAAERRRAVAAGAEVELVAVAQQDVEVVRIHQVDADANCFAHQNIAGAQVQGIFDKAVAVATAQIRGAGLRRGGRQGDGYRNAVEHVAAACQVQAGGHFATATGWCCRTGGIPGFDRAGQALAGDAERSSISRTGYGFCPFDTIRRRVDRRVGVQWVDGICRQCGFVAAGDGHRQIGGGITELGSGASTQFWQGRRQGRTGAHACNIVARFQIHQLRRQADIAAGTGQCRWRVGGAGGAVAADDVGAAERRRAVAAGAEVELVAVAQQDVEVVRIHQVDADANCFAHQNIAGAQVQGIFDKAVAVATAQIRGAGLRRGGRQGDGYRNAVEHVAAACQVQAGGHFATATGWCCRTGGIPGFDRAGQALAGDAERSSISRTGYGFCPFDTIRRRVDRRVGVQWVDGICRQCGFVAAGDGHRQIGGGITELGSGASTQFWQGRRQSRTGAHACNKRPGVQVIQGNGDCVV